LCCNTLTGIYGTADRLWKKPLLGKSRRCPFPRAFPDLASSLPPAPYHPWRNGLPAKDRLPFQGHMKLRLGDISIVL
jgi:hypothetical protein